MSEKIPKDYPGKILLSDEERYVRLVRASALLLAESEAVARQAMRILNRTERRKNSADQAMETAEA
jgi:hypothetical protein